MYTFVQVAVYTDSVCLYTYVYVKVYGRERRREEEGKREESRHGDGNRDKVTRT